MSLGANPAPGGRTKAGEALERRAGASFAASRGSRGPLAYLPARCHGGALGPAPVLGRLIRPSTNSSDPDINHQQAAACLSPSALDLSNRPPKLASFPCWRPPSSSSMSSTPTRLFSLRFSHDQWSFRSSDDFMSVVYVLVERLLVPEGWWY